VLFVALAVATTVASTVASPARAEASAASQAEARKVMRRSIQDLEAGKNEPALAGFRRASELVPEANLPHRYAGRALEALGRFEEAIVEYQTYLRIKAEVSDAASIRATIDTLGARTVGTVIFRCTPDEVGVTVDGRESPLGEDRSLRLPRGTHRVIVRARGHADRALDVEVPGGGTVTPPCVLELATAAAPPPPVPGPPVSSEPTGASLRTSTSPSPPPSSEADTSRPLYAKWWFWAGTGAAVVAGAVITGLVLSSGGGGPPSTEGGDHRFP